MPHGLAQSRRPVKALHRSARRTLQAKTALAYADGGSGSVAGLREQRLTGSAIHETGLPESGRSPPAPYAAELTADCTTIAQLDTLSRG